MSKNPPKTQALCVPDFEYLEESKWLWDWIMDRYFRLEMNGFENVPEQNCLVIANHGGGALAMDGWMTFFGWARHFGADRPLNGTAHDVLMNAPKIGKFFRRIGTMSPSKENIVRHLEGGHDVLLFPGGEEDALRAWKRRDEVVLAQRKGFIRLAIKQQVPILPVATQGGHDCEFILSEGRGIAKALNFPKYLRSNMAPITLSWPFGLMLEVLPLHLPFPAKIRTEILEPIHLDKDPEKANDNDYVQRVYDEMIERMQASVDTLAAKRRFPVFA